jgi:hypothetical protein
MSTNRWGISPGHSERKNLECEGYNYDIDPKYYAKCRIKPVKSKIAEIKDRDLFGEIAEKAKRKGLSVYALVVHRFQELEKYADLHMRAVNGEKIPAVLCHNNPEVKNYYKCMIDHLHDKYELDGFCYALVDHYALFGFQSLTDELADTLGIKTFATPEMGLSCFCDTCVEQASRQGIDVDRVKRGLLKGIKLGYIPHKVERMSAANEAVRFLLDVPEYLDWLRFRSSRMTELHKELYGYLKAKSERYQVGLDIYGAKDDWKYQTRFEDIAKHCEWIKPMFYSSTYEEPLGPQQIGDGVSLAKSLSGKSIYPGISCLCSQPQEKIEQALDFSLKKGADGVVISWDYALVPYQNMRVVKERLKKEDLV